MLSTTPCAARALRPGKISRSGSAIKDVHVLVVVPILAGAQERILNLAIFQDARRSAIEPLYVHVVLQMCRSAAAQRVPANPEPQRGVQSPQRQETNCEVLDSVDVHEVFEMRFRVLQSCPHHLRGRFQHAARCALEARHQAVRAGDRVMELRAWKLFCLLPFWLFQRPQGQGRVGKAELCDRFDKFLFLETVIGAHSTKQLADKHPRWISSDRNAQNRIWERGEGTCGTAENPVGRSVPRTTESNGSSCRLARRFHILGDAKQTTTGCAVLEFEPEEPVTLDWKILLRSLKSSPRGSSPGPGGALTST